MGNTADLAMVQKTIIDTLHKEGKSQRVILKGVAVHGVLYQSILNAQLTGRKKLCRKMCTSNRDDRKLENSVKQSRFKYLWEFHKEWTEAESVHQESPRSDIFRKRATKPLLKQKHRQKHLTWAKKKTVTVPRRSPRKNRDLGPSAGKVILIIKSKANRQKQNSNQKRDTLDGNVVLVSRAHKPNVIGEQEKQWTYIHMWVWVI